MPSNEAQSPAAPPVYDRRTILYHWIVVALIAAQWLGAQAIDWFPRGPLRVDARSVHILFGALLAGVIVARIAWRATRGRRLPQPGGAALRLAASVVHGLLYLLVSVTVLLGFLNTWARGDSLFNLVSIPKLTAFGPNLHRTVQELHGLCANAILAVAAVHASAALWHHYVRRDGLLGRMIPAMASTR